MNKQGVYPFLLFKSLPPNLLQDLSMRFPGQLGLDRTLYFLKLVDSPHNTLKVIHVAGTSGKGSVSYLISRLLASQGFSTGLHLSPPLFDWRERFLVNNCPLPFPCIQKYLLELEPQIKQMANSQYGPLSQFELLVALSYYIFAKHKVQYVVIETGLGGRLDATNVVSTKTKVCVITSVDKDHAHILGPTLAKIAWQKAGIIKPYNLVFSSETKPNIKEVFNKQATSNRTSIQYISEPQNFHAISVLATGSKFNFQIQDFALKNIQLGLLGKFQIKNAALALAVVVALAKRDQFKLSKPTLLDSLKSARFAGRFQVVKSQGKQVVFDSAHSPIKIKSLIQSLKLIYPQDKFSFLIAIKNTKDYQKMLQTISSNAKSIILTQFQTNRASYQKPVSISVMQRYLLSINFQNFQITASAKDGLNLLLKQKNTVYIVAGSIYLLQDLLDS